MVGMRESRLGPVPGTIFRIEIMLGTSFKGEMMCSVLGILSLGCLRDGLVEQIIRQRSMGLECSCLNIEFS